MTAISIPWPAPRNKYWFAATLAVRQQLAEPGQLAARGALYALILFVFSRVWYALPGDASGRIWYLAVCEWISLSQPRIYLAIERDLRNGEISCALTRPCSYLGMKLSEGAGELALQLCVLAPIGVLCAIALGADVHVDPRGVLALLALAPLASALLLSCHALIGLCAFAIRDVNPIYWVFQKALFLLGGLLVPLELYPDWLRTLALWSPFSAILYGPAHALTAFDSKLVLCLLVKLAASLALAKIALEALYASATRALLHDGDGT